MKIAKITKERWNVFFEKENIFLWYRMTRAARNNGARILFELYVYIDTIKETIDHKNSFSLCNDLRKSNNPNSRKNMASFAS
jgi:hypothetical protein